MRQHQPLCIFLIFIIIFGCGGGGGGGGGGGNNNNNTSDELNNAPIADAGVDQNVNVGSIVYLSASNSSDPDGDPIFYTWSFFQLPESSNAVIIGVHDLNASFVADVQGVYIVSLLVSDGIQESSESTIEIQVEQQTLAWAHSKGPEGGSVQCTASDSQGAIYAGTACGIYKSNDNGATWQKGDQSSHNSYIETAVINAIIITDDDVIIVGTNGGIYKSTDNGATYRWINSGILRGINAFCKGPSGLLYAGTGGGIFNRNILGNVFYSDDDGESWQLIDPDFPDKNVLALDMNPQGDLFIGTNDGVYRLRPSDSNWENVSDGLNDKTVSALAIGPSGEIIAGTQDGVYQTINQGDDWSLLKESSRRIRDLAFNQDGYMFQAGPGFISRSTNSGNTWQGLIYDLPNCNVDAYQLNLLPDNTIYVSTNFGVFRSRNNGDNWTRGVSGLFATNVYSLTNSDSGKIYAATKNGLFQMHEQGNKWYRTPSTAPNGFNTNVQPDYVLEDINGDIIAVLGHLMYRSEDDGNSWNNISNYDSYGTGYNEKMVINNRGYYYLQKQRGGIYRSIDRGENWQRVDNIDDETFIYDIAIGPSDILFVTADEHGLIRSIDDGDTWEIIANGIESVVARDIAVGINEEIYLTTLYDYLYRSLDNGLSWQKVTNNIPAKIHSIMTDDDNNIILGTRNGVFISADQGNNWTVLQHGIENRFIYALTKDSAGYIYAGTLYNGVFKSIEPID